MSDYEPILKYMKISDIDLSNRIKSVLRGRGVNTLYDLIIMSHNDILTIKRFGQNILDFLLKCQNDNIFFKNQLKLCNLPLIHKFSDKVNKNLINSIIEANVAKQICAHKNNNKEKKDINNKIKYQNKLCNYKFNENLKNLYIEDVSLSDRTKNLLYRANIFNLYDLFILNQESFHKIYGLGNVSSKEINDFIDKFFNDQSFYKTQLKQNHLPENYSIDSNFNDKNNHFKIENTNNKIEEFIKKFNYGTKPSIKQIIKDLIEYNSNLADNDREFCFLFDEIALNNGYEENTLPSYWTIGREIFRYKKENNIFAKEKTNQILLSTKLLDLKKYNVKIFCPEGKKPSTAKIIEVIWKNYNYAFKNDRLLVKIFDCIAINNGVHHNELPKYWNIIRAAFDYKKDKKQSEVKIDVACHDNDSNNGIIIDYRVLEIKLEELNLDQRLKNKLQNLELRTIADFLSVDAEFYKNNRLAGLRKAEIYSALYDFNINPDNEYIPAAIVLPDIYYKKLDKVFDDEIIQILKKFQIKNIGLLANKFPDILINDEELIENPKIFEYIDSITKILNKLGISDLPINLSKFQIEDLQKPTKEEFYDINYVEEMINAINNEINNLKENAKDTIIKRFGLIDGQKRTLEEIGKEYGVTRERIRQLESINLTRISRSINPKLKQINEYLNQILTPNNNCVPFEIQNGFLNYENIIKELLNYSKTSFYVDFNVGLIIKEGITLEDLLDDDSVATDLKVKIEKFVYKDYIKINNHRVKNTKNDILIYFLRTHCRKGVKFNDFQNLYMDFLISNGLSDRDDLLYFDNTLYNKLSVMDCLLLSPGKFLRYYDVELAKDLVKKLDLSSYKDIEISCRKLYLENLDLMQEYEIENEYELHNLLKKHLHNNYIDFSRMPIINFGTPNREKQMEDLLYQLSPIKSRDFALAYEDKYGVDTKNFIANYAKLINQYLINGYYVIHTENLDNEHLNALKNSLIEDFYWKEDLENIYISLFNDGNIKNLNAQNIKLLNYTMTSNCIYSDRFNSLADCIEHILLKSNIFNLNINNKFRTLHTFYLVFAKLRNNLDIIEFDLDKYISFKKLESVGLNKNDLYEYQNKVINYIGDKYFTVISLKNDGLKYDKLDKLGFDEYFYSSILINNPSIQYRKIKNTYLMKKGEEQFELSDFLIYIMGKLRKIDIYDLCDYIKTQYGLDINRYKIVAITKECSLYYNQITEKVYIDYDEFYNEI